MKPSKTLLKCFEIKELPLELAEAVEKQEGWHQSMEFVQEHYLRIKQFDPQCKIVQPRNDPEHKDVYRDSRVISIYMQYSGRCSIATLRVIKSDARYHDAKKTHDITITPK